MTELNGHKRAKGDVARRILRDIGEGCTYAQFCEGATAEGERPVEESTYYAIRLELWPHLRQRRGNGRPMTLPAVLPTGPAVPTVIPDDRPPLGTLARLVKFGAIVESVGGLDEAQRMLDALRELAGRFGGDQ